MNTNRSLRLMKFAVLALVTVGFSVSLAHAQECEGKFTLPFEARWGTAVLPPGDYSFTVGQHGNPGQVIVQGNSMTVMIAVANRGTSDYKDSKHSALIAVRSGGKYRIIALEFAPLKLSLHYAEPKTERQLLAQAPELTQRISVTVNQ